MLGQCLLNNAERRFFRIALDKVCIYRLSQLYNKLVLVLHLLPYFLAAFCLFVFHAFCFRPFFTDTSNILTRIGLGDVNIPAPAPPSMPYPVGSLTERQIHRGYRKFDSTYRSIS